jgi:hypothetical protein
MKVRSCTFFSPPPLNITLFHGSLFDIITFVKDMLFFYILVLLFFNQKTLELLNFVVYGRNNDVREIAIP